MPPEKLLALADAVRDAHARLLWAVHGHRHPMSESIAARADLTATKQALRAAWLDSTKAERGEALRSASTHGVKCGDSPFAAISSRERLEALVNLPLPERAAT